MGRWINKFELKSKVSHDEVVLKVVYLYLPVYDILSRILLLLYSMICYRILLNLDKLSESGIFLYIRDTLSKAAFKETAAEHQLAQ